MSGRWQWAIRRWMWPTKRLSDQRMPTEFVLVTTPETEFRVECELIRPSLTMLFDFIYSQRCN